MGSGAAGLPSLLAQSVVGEGLKPGPGRATILPRTSEANPAQDLTRIQSPATMTIVLKMV